jgi:putative transport protein
MEFIKSLLEQQPMFALFVTIAIGYAVGEISLRGFSLGVGAVLFVALAIGWFAPHSAPAPMVGTLGLALFLYAVGAQYGKQFFLGFTSAYGRRANLIALVGVLISGVVSLLCMKVYQISPGHALGLFAGSGTSTATLQAAIAKLGNDDAAVGYSVSYPFGVAGPILLLYLTFAVLKPKVAVPASAGMEILEVAIADSHLNGKTVGELMSGLPEDVQIVARRRQHHNEPATADVVLAEHDVLLMVGPSREALERAGKTLGNPEPGRMVKDRQHLDYLRVFASRATAIGRTVGELALPGAHVAVVVHVRRGEADLLAHPDLVIESGDRVGMLASPADFAALRAFFGNSIKGTADFSYISIGLGMALGFLLGAVTVPLPGIGKISLGLSGVLIVALIFGKLRRTGSLNWTIPLSANLVLRNLGLTLFLAQVGMTSGPRFAATVSQTGLEMLGIGAVILLALAVPIIVLGLFVCHMSFDQVAGIVAGACGNPAILSYASKLAPTDEPDIGYAMIFPGMTIVKILFVDIVPAFLGR